MGPFFLGVSLTHSKDVVILNGGEADVRDRTTKDSLHDVEESLFNACSLDDLVGCATTT